MVWIQHTTRKAVSAWTIKNIQGKSKASDPINDSTASLVRGFVRGHGESSLAQASPERDLHVLVNARER